MARLVLLGHLSAVGLLDSGIDWAVGRVSCGASGVLGMVVRYGDRVVGCEISGLDAHVQCSG